MDSHGAEVFVTAGISSSILNNLYPGMKWNSTDTVDFLKPVINQQ